LHVFYRVLALAIAHLMRRHAAQAGLDMPTRELLTTLADIGETVMIYPSTGGRPKARRMLTEMTRSSSTCSSCSVLPVTPPRLGHTTQPPPTSH
jgi:hypothetical protein